MIWAYLAVFVIFVVVSLIYAPMATSKDPVERKKFFSIFLLTMLVVAILRAIEKIFDL